MSGSTWRDATRFPTCPCCRCFPGLARRASTLSSAARSVRPERGGMGALPSLQPLCHGSSSPRVRPPPRTGPGEMTSMPVGRPTVNLRARVGRSRLRTRSCQAMDLPSGATSSRIRRPELRKPRVFRCENAYCSDDMGRRIRSVRAVVSRGSSGRHDASCGHPGHYSSRTAGIAHQGPWRCCKARRRQNPAGR